MGRHNQLNAGYGFGREREPRVQRESPDGRVLKIYRRVGQEVVEVLGGVTAELMQSGDIPPIKLATRAEAYLLDPRLMPRGFNEGLLTGYQLNRVLSRIGKKDELDEEGYDVKVGAISLLPAKNRTVVMNLESLRLKNEKVAVNQVMAAAEVKGYKTDGNVTWRHNVQPTSIVLGTFEETVKKYDALNIVDCIATSIEQGLRATTGGDIRLGKFEIHTYQPR